MTKDEAKNKITIKNQEFYPYLIIDNVDEIIDEIYNYFEKEIRHRDNTIKLQSKKILQLFEEIEELKK